MWKAIRKIIWISFAIILGILAFGNALHSVKKEANNTTKNVTSHIRHNDNASATWELRFANRYYRGPNYIQKEDSMWLIGNTHKGYYVERHSLYYNTNDECETAKLRMKQTKNNPHLWWAECRKTR